MTFDQLALKAMMSGDAGLMAQLKRSAEITLGRLCPVCESTDTESYHGHEILCRDCDEVYDVRDYNQIEY